MEAIQVMPSEIESLHGAVAEMRSHFDQIIHDTILQIIHDTILPRMDRLESKVDLLDVRARETNGNVTELKLWRAHIQGATAVAGRSWQSLLAIGSVAVAIVSVVLANT